MSFADPDLMPGTQFLGVTILEVSDTEAEDAKRLLPPYALPGAEWLQAGMKKAWALGCNPGGQIQWYEIPEAAMHKLENVPRGVLMSKNRLKELGLIE